MEIKPRQVWITRDGETVYVGEKAAGAFCWPVSTEKDGTGCCWRVTATGNYQITGIHGSDLARLVGGLPEDDGAKLSNPKEAIGDKKVPLWLCSPVAEAHWAAAQFCGLTKYGAWNWRAAGVRTSTYLSAIKRHHGRYSNGERLDPVDGTLHLGNIMACAAILLEAEYLGKLNDDRPPPADLQKVFDEVEGICGALKAKYADKEPKHWTIADTLP